MRKLWIQVVVLALALVGVLVAKHYVNRLADGPFASDEAPPVPSGGGTAVTVEPAASAP